jgi:hypothetical protein
MARTHPAIIFQESTDPDVYSRTESRVLVYAYSAECFIAIENGQDDDIDEINISDADARKLVVVLQRALTVIDQRKVAVSHRKENLL